MTEPSPAHPREVPLGYAVHLSVKEWSSYVLDDFGVSYTSGYWPYHRDRVRLAPDAGPRRRWGNEYVWLQQGARDPETAVAALELLVRGEGTGRAVVAVSGHLDLVSGGVTLVPGDLEEDLWLEAMIKVHRVLDLLREERARRDGPDRPSDPDTAYDREARGATSPPSRGPASWTSYWCARDQHDTCHTPARGCNCRCHQEDSR